MQPSNKRVFADSEFEKAGAIVTEDLGDASVIFGLKQVGDSERGSERGCGSTLRGVVQVPVGDLLPERTYVFFSHTIKVLLPPRMGPLSLGRHTRHKRRICRY